MNAGRIITYGENKVAVVTSIEVHQSPGEFARVRLEILLPMFELNCDGLRNIDFGEILGSKTVKKAIENEFEEKLRTITFDDQ